MLYLAFSCRIALVVVFGVSAVSKLREPDAFARSLRDMRMLPRRLVRATALTVIAGEAAVAVLLLLPWAAAGVAGFGLAIALLAGFIAVIVRSLRHGDRTPCRCFGRSTTPLGTEHVLRNAVLITAATAGLTATATATAPAAAVMSGAGPTTAGGLLLAGAAGLLAGGLVTMLDDLISLFRPLDPASPADQEPDNPRTTTALTRSTGSNPKTHES